MLLLSAFLAITTLSAGILRAQATDYEYIVVGSGKTVHAFSQIVANERLEEREEDR